MAAGEGLLTKPVMFLSSYAPLFVMLTIRFDGRNLRVACFAAAVIGVTAVVLLVRRQAGVSAGDYVIVTARSAGGEASAYLAGYLLPFLTVSEPSSRDLLAYGVFFLVAGVVHVRTGIIQVNPVLFVLGWKVLAVEDENGYSGYLITKKRVLRGDTVRASRISDDVIVDHAALEP